MQDLEKEKEILEVLKGVAEAYRSSPSEGSLRTYAKMLLRYGHRTELFRYLWAIPKLYGEYPTKITLEHDVRKALQMEPLKGLSEDLIEKNTEALLKEGVSPEKVKASEDFMKRILGTGAPPEKTKTLDEIISEIDLEF
jgi:hypothetical protein